MKEKIMLFVIGVLVGAVISTGTFFIYTKAVKCNNQPHMQMRGGTPPSMPNGQNNDKAPDMPNNNTENENAQNSTQNNS